MRTPHPPRDRSPRRRARIDAADISVARFAAQTLAMTMVIVGAVLVRVEITAAGIIAALVGTLLLFDLDGAFERLAARVPRARARAARPHRATDERPSWERSVASGS